MILLAPDPGGIRREERKADGTFCSLTVIPPYNYPSIKDDFEKSNSPEHWTRLTIKDGAKYDKDDVLDAILSFLYPITLTPVLYQTDGDDTFCLFQYGREVVRKLFNADFRVLLSGCIKEQITVNVSVHYLTVEEEPYNPQSDIIRAITKRFNETEGVLDLRNLKNDPDLKRVYISLRWDPYLFRVIKTTGMKSVKIPLKGLLLSHNELDQPNALLELRRPNYYQLTMVDIRQLATLDLRYNKITFSGFESIPSLDIRHLLVEGNPICNDFETPEEMVFFVKQKMPTLKTLDNVDIDNFMENRVRFKLYVRNPAYSSLVDHFLHHYYSLFEKDREKLIQTYQKDAQLSVSICRNESLQAVIAGDFFNSSNRNLLSMSDVTKTYDNLYVGKLRIFEALKSMPSITFDPYSFQVDVPITAKGELVVICSTGAFCLNESVTRDMFLFSRVSVLCPLRNGLGEWTIYNDMWTVSTSCGQTMKHLSKYGSKVKSDFAVMLNPQLKDKEILIRVVSELTSLKKAWVEKFLSESVWDLEMALLAFTDQYKANLIPAEAFNPVADAESKN